jgi:hypothetical protein
VVSNGELYDCFHGVDMINTSHGKTFVKELALKHRWLGRQRNEK